MGLTLSEAELLRVRLRGLGLDGALRADDSSTNAGSAGDDSSNSASAGAARSLAVATHMFALQGQDWRSSKWAIGVRAPGLTAADVTAALNDGSIVRSWPMRGTVHLVPAADIGWMQQLTNPRVLAGAARRREILGMSDRVLEHATEVSLAALAGGRSLDRAELAEVWTAAGIDWQPNWRYHLIWWLCQNGLTTFGPVPEAAAGSADPEPRLVLAAEWIPRPRTLSGDDALREFAARYVRGRGAVTRKDLAAWAQLPAAAASRGLALAVEAGQLVEARRAGVSGTAGALWVDPDALEALEAAAPAVSHTRGEAGDWQLLPAFDEHILGFQDRSPQFDAAHLGQLVPGKNGVFLATVVADGRTVGTWRRDPKRDLLTVTPFSGERIDLEAIRPASTRWADFTGRPHPDLALAVPGS
ncbi:winged helix DNA-binding domain-containing protein [Leucobacter sp. BZR 635]